MKCRNEHDSNRKAISSSPSRLVVKKLTLAGTRVGVTIPPAVPMALVKIVTVMSVLRQNGEKGRTWKAAEVLKRPDGEK